MTMMMQLLCVGACLLAVSVDAYTLDYGSLPAFQLAAPAGSYSLNRGGDFEYAKRFMPQKERRAPLDGFDDMPGLLRSLDGIQKPRFG